MDVRNPAGINQADVLALVRESYVNAAEFGWDPAATAAVNETAFNNARDAAYSRKLPLYLGRGTFQKTNGLDLRSTDTRADGLVMFGAGRANTTITVTTNTAELLRLGGYNLHVSDFSIRRTATNPDANTAGGMVFYKLAYSSVQRVNITTASSGAMVTTTDVHEPGTSSGVGSYVFSCVFDDVNINRYWRSGIYLSGIGSTGCVWTNTYVQNGAPGAALTSTGAPVEIVGCSEQVFNQLNIEDHTGVGIGILLNQAHVTIVGLHWERVPLAGYRPQYIRVYGISSLDLSTMTLSFADVGQTGANAVSDYGVMFTVGLGGAIFARSLFVSEMTKTGTTGWRLVEVDDTDARNSITIEQPMVKDGSPAFTSLTSATAANGLKRIGDTSYVPAAAPAVHIGRRYKTGAGTAVTSYSNFSVPLDTVATGIGTKVGTGTANAFVATVAGVYRPTCRVSYTGGTSAKHSVITQVNGATKYENALTFAGAGTVTSVAPGDEQLLVLAAGDVVTFATYVETGSVLIDSSTTASTVATLQYLGASS